MRILLLAFLSLCSPAATAEPIRHTLSELVKSQVPANWNIAVDMNRIVATTDGVQFRGGSSIDPILLRPGEDIWANAPTTHFIIEIRIAPLISKEGYQKLGQLRKELLAERIRQFENGRKEKIDGKSLFGLKKEVDEMLPLPFCHDERSSIYFHASGGGATRPESARNAAESLRKALGDRYPRYQPIDKASGSDPSPVSDME